jgi:ribose transport system substrate-binding protein
MEMRKALLLIAAAAMAVTTASAMAQKKTLAVVVKGLDNPFFTVLGNGCNDWNAANPNSEYTCLYTGPALTSDEAGEVQLVADLIARDDVAGIAISPSNAPAMANLLREKQAEIKAKGIAVMTIDADLEAADRSLRSTYLGTENYQMGVLMAKYATQFKPAGGTVCLQLGNVAANNINERAAGFRDTISGAKGTEKLTGQNGWTEVAGCPLYTNDDIATANQQFADVTGANADLDAFILVGGWAQFGPEAYKANCTTVKARIDSKDLVIIAGDTLPPQMEAPKAGCSHAQVGQRPYEMGNRASDVLQQLIEGKTVEDPLYTGLDECTQENADKCLAG